MTKIRDLFSVGGLLLLSAFIVSVILVLTNLVSPRLITKYAVYYYFGCLIIDHFCNQHLLFNFGIHQQIAFNEKSLLNSLTKKEQQQLVDWYADWLALFTHSFGRWCDLCVFQIAGTMEDLLEFRRKQRLFFIDSSIAEQFVKKWDGADEQVFKVFYGSKIKRKSFFKMIKLTWQVKYHNTRREYLEFLLDRYGKHYYEYGIFLVDRVRAGDDVRSLYTGLTWYQDVAMSFSRKAYAKAILQSSAYSLKTMLAKRKSS